MKKKKIVKDEWCPLTDQYKHFTLKHKTIIERARALWSRPGVPYRTPDGRTIPTVKPFSKEDKEKARAILYKWDALQKDYTYIWTLADNIKGIQNSGAMNCEEFLQKTVSWFKELDPTPLEVFSILAIHEARVSENLEMALELLAVAEKYSPDAMHGRKFKRQPGGKRFDALRRVTAETFTRFKNDHKHEPTAQELLEALPLDGAVQEIDREDRSIYWINDRGIEKETTFKAFQNSLSGLKKGIAKKIKKVKK